MVRQNHVGLQMIVSIIYIHRTTRGSIHERKIVSIGGSTAWSMDQIGLIDKLNRSID